MSWLHKVSGKENSTLLSIKESPQTETRMSPGLNGEYDCELREKAGMHEPPPPPEYMGLEGEYDQLGLAKRTAVAFDREPELKNIETLSIGQNGSTIVLKGTMPNQSLVSQLKALAAKVDGTKAVDVTQVKVAV